MVYYGPANFLWLSDIVLFLTLVGVILENRLLISMAGIGGIVIELLWGLSFVFSIFYKCCLPRVTDYMFDPALPFWVRFLSLFHVVLPFVLVWLIMRIGYVQLALPLQTLFVWIVLVITWLTTPPADNINAVFSYLIFNISPFLYLMLEGLLLAAVFFATHKVLVTIKRR